MINFLLKICTDLENENIPYMLGGSLAMGFYTTQRTTLDIDMVIELKKEDVAKFVSIFQNAYCYEPSILEEIERKGLFNVIDFATGIKVDFFIKKTNEYDEMAFNRKQKLTDLGQGIWVTSLEDLILAKLRWIQQIMSDRQLNDIRNLLENPQSDKEYILYWITNLRLNTFDLTI